MGENYYVLFVLGMSAIVILVAGFIRKSYVLSNQMELANRARRRKQKTQVAEQKKENQRLKLSLRENKPSPVMTRELQNVRTPWGWPHHVVSASKEDADHADVSHSIRRFAGRLINPKKTKEDQDYLEKRNASIRALLEDRYGRASRMTEMPYRKVKAPLLRDPNEPFDQLDNLPSSKAGGVVSRLRKQPNPALDFTIPSHKPSDLKNVKTPWGW